VLHLKQAHVVPGSSRKGRDALVTDSQGLSADYSDLGHCGLVLEDCVLGLEILVWHSRLICSD